MVPALSYFRVFESYELQTYDWRFQIRHDRPMSPKIVFIEIADDSIQAIGEWPFPRQYHAALIEALQAYGAKSIVLDFIFAERRPEDPLFARVAHKAGNVLFGLVLKDPTLKGDEFVSESILARLRGILRRAAKGVGIVNAKADVDGKRRRVPPVVRLNNQYFFN